MLKQRRRLDPEAGTTVVEVALAAVVFLMLVIGIVDFGRMHYCRSRLQYAVSQATRFAAIGNKVDDPNNKGGKLSRRDSIISEIRRISGMPNLSESNISITSTTAGGAQVKGPGGPGDVVTVQVTYGVPLTAPYLNLAFKDGEWTFRCTTSFRNEEFSGGA